MRQKVLARGAFLIAAAVVLQAIRLVLPLPPMAGMFIIGTLVNMMLVLSLRLNNLLTAAAASFLLPICAYLQGQLALPFLIPIVMLGNILFVILADKFRAGAASFLLPPAAKAAFMCAAAFLLLRFLELRSPVLEKTVLFAMSAPQFITGVSGVYCAGYLLQALKKRL